jgi:hypothetical protein
LPFPFFVAENKQKLPFSVSSVFHLRNSRNTETRRNGDLEIWRHEDGDSEAWRNKDMERETLKEKWKPRQFSLIHL